MSFLQGTTLIGSWVISPLQTRAEVCFFCPPFCIARSPTTCDLPYRFPCYQYDRELTPFHPQGAFPWVRSAALWARQTLSASPGTDVRGTSNILHLQTAGNNLPRGSARFAGAVCVPRPGSGSGGAWSSAAQGWSRSHRQASCTASLAPGSGLFVGRSPPATLPRSSTSVPLRS